MEWRYVLGGSVDIIFVGEFDRINSKGNSFYWLNSASKVIVRNQYHFIIVYDYPYYGASDGKILPLMPLNCNWIIMPSHAVMFAKLKGFY